MVMVTFYLQAETWVGFLDLADEERLSDFLNTQSPFRPKNKDNFIQIEDVTINQTDGSQVILSDAYLNKAVISLVVIQDGDSARGIGSGIEPKRYPYVYKSPLPAVLELPAYTLNGILHCSDGQSLQELLNQSTDFLPLTDVTITPYPDGPQIQEPFALVNKEQILASTEQPD